jgi:hypothetical protein
MTAGRSRARSVDERISMCRVGYGEKFSPNFSLCYYKLITEQLITSEK